MASLDCNAGRLERTASPNVQTFTACWWQRFDSAVPDDNVAPFALISADTSRYIGLVTFGGNVLYYFSDGGTTVVACDTTWRFFAMTRASIGGGNYATNVYHATRGSAFTTFTQSPQGAETTPLYTYFGGSGFGDTFPGEIRDAKIWDGVALTPEELAREMYTSKPRRWDSLWFWNPLLTTAGAGVDLSGNGNTFSTFGTLALSEQDPGIPYDRAA